MKFNVQRLFQDSAFIKSEKVQNPTFRMTSFFIIIVIIIFYKNHRLFILLVSLFPIILAQTLFFM